MLCSEQKQIRHVVDKKSKYALGKLCKQYHFDFPARHSPGKSRGQYKYRRKKKHYADQKYYHNRYRKKPQIHQNRPYEHPQRRKSSKRKEKPPDRPRKTYIRTPKCYECGGEHLRPQCPKWKGKGKVQSLTEELAQLKIKEKELINALDHYDTGDDTEENDYSSSSDYEIRQIKESGVSESESSDDSTSQCECINVLTEQQRTTMMNEALKIEDLKSRDLILDYIMRNESGKDQKINHPTEYVNVSFERNVVQQQKKLEPDILSIDSVNRKLKELEIRVKQIESRVSVTESLLGFQEPAETSRQQEETYPESENLNVCSIIVQEPLIQVEVTINGKKETLIALLDSGSTVNAIRSDLVSVFHEKPSKIKNIISISGDNKIQSETDIILHLSQKHKKDLKISAILHTGLTADLYLGNPFIQYVQPSRFEKKDGIQYFIFTLGKKQIAYPFVSGKRINHQIHRLKERREEIRQIKQSLSIEQQLMQPGMIQKIDDIRKRFLKFCGNHPGVFWKKRKHFVELPFKENYIEQPHYSKAIPMNEEQLKLCHDEISDLLEQGLIKKSKSPWSSFGFYVNKHSEIVRGKPRLVINFKPLNNCLSDDCYPLPKPTDILSKLKQTRVYSKFDLKSGFWQVLIDPKDTYKTGFTVPRGHYEWLVMPFGLKNAPSVFQRIIDQMLKGLEHFCQGYIDDILVFSNDIPAHIKHLKAVERRIEEYGVVLSEKKMEIFKVKICFLGYEIYNGSYSAMGHSLQFVHNFPDKITDTKQLQRFLGCLNYISHFYERCAADRKVLNRRLKKNPPEWNDECTQAVQRIKQKVEHLPILYLFQEGLPTEVYSDASDNGWGAALVQKADSTDKKRNLCRYASGIWNDTQQKWHINKKEMAAILLAVKKFHDYIVWQRFVIFTDNKALPDLFKKKDTKEAVIARWLMELSQYRCDIRYVKGIHNEMADMLSREYLIKAHNPQDPRSEKSINGWLGCEQIHSLQIEAQLEDMADNAEYPDEVSFEQYVADWKPREVIQYSFEQPSYDKDTENERAERDLASLSEKGLIRYYKNNIGCIIHFLIFPVDLDEEISEAYEQIFKFQNESYNFFYICLFDGWMNPVSHWFKHWYEKYMMWSITVHPEYLKRDIVGRPNTVGDVKKYFCILDYGSNNDWMIRTDVYQQKVKAEIPMEDEMEWLSLQDPMEREELGEQILNITKFDINVCFMHEEFDWGDHVFSYRLSDRWYHTISNISVPLCKKNRKLDKGCDVPLWRPQHIPWFVPAKRRFEYYCTQLASYVNEVYSFRQEEAEGVLISYRQIIPMQVEPRQDNAGRIIQYIEDQIALGNYDPPYHINNGDDAEDGPNGPNHDPQWVRLLNDF